MQINVQLMIYIYIYTHTFNLQLLYYKIYGCGGLTGASKKYL